MILPLLILVLLAGGILSWVAGRKSKILCRWIAVAALLIDLIAVLYIWISEDAFLTRERPDPFLEYRQEWIERFGIGFHLALDGLSLILLALTYFLGILSVFASWKEIRERTGFFHLNVLLVLAGISGIFLARDLFLFYFSWELMLVPMYFLIGIWGHGKRVYASYKFFLFTQTSGLLMFAAILGIYFIHGAQTGNYTFDLVVLADTRLTDTMSWLLMGGFLAGFLVKLPAIPFHSWLPDAHTEAPTAGSVLLAGLLLKTGAYGLLRIVLPLFPSAVDSFSLAGMILGVAGILYGAKLAYAQTDLKRMIAYSSISHMGFIILGVFALNELALQGVVMQIVAHGISTASLFMIAGLLQERTHTRELDAYGGLWERAPVMGGMTLVFVLASLGLPGMAAFVAEFLVILGSYRANVPVAIFASLGFIVSVIYSLRLFQRIFYGTPASPGSIIDLDMREILILVPSVILLFWFGLFPRTLFHLSGTTVRTVLKVYEQVAPTSIPGQGWHPNGSGQVHQLFSRPEQPADHVKSPKPGEHP